MKLDILLGLQWGDEGKGKIVDVLSPDYEAIARFQGGPNAGHTLIFNNQKFVLHTIPSGVFRADTQNIIGNGVVIDPVIFSEEIEHIKKDASDLNNNLLISKKAHLILPTHRILDAAQEAAKGKDKIGSTLKGISPTYTDKISRNGLRVGDILSPDFKEKYNKLVEKHKKQLSNFDFDYNLAEFEKGWFEGIELIKTFKIIDSEIYTNNLLSEEKPILAEGAQGTLLDIEFGSYPFVTSSNTIAAGACTGLGIAPNKIGEVFGIFKAYCTRVGSGPFPTELFDEGGKRMQDVGNEFGATTGRPRRCGWLDLVALKYAIMLNGVTQLVITKADVLSGFETIKIATSYKVNGEEIDYLPYEINDNNIEPIYTELRGWQNDISEAKSLTELPTNLKIYLQFIEEFVGVPINFISVGPDRDAMITK